MAINKSQGQPGDNQRSDFTGASIPNRIGYRFSDLDPASNIYIQRDDQLFFQWGSSLNAESINVTVRLLTPGRDAGRTQPDASTKDNKLGDSPYGVVIPLQLSFVGGAAGAVNTNTMQLAEGYLLSLSVSSNLAVTRGQTFVRVFILRTRTSIANTGYVLASDYCSQTAAIGWPIGAIVSPVLGKGNLKLLQVANPAAGADWTYTMSGSVRQRINSIQATLTTAVAAANRGVSLRLADTLQGLTLGTYPANATQAASLTGIYSAGSGLVGSAMLNTVLCVNLPNDLMLVHQGQQFNTLSSVTANLQAADQWSNIILCVEEWLDF